MQISHFIKICSVGAKLFQVDIHDEANSAFHNFENALKNAHIALTVIKSNWHLKPRQRDFLLYEAIL
jgi:hypothetical protein